MTDSNRHAAPSVTDRANRSFTIRGPYAGPARSADDRLSVDRVAAAPYVPAPFRGKPSLEVATRGQAVDGAMPSDEREALPSIDQFLSVDAATASRGIETPGADMSGALPSSTPEGQWPLDEAGAELQRIGDLFEEPADETTGLFAGALDEAGLEHPVPPTSKPMWRTDEWMDIMPVSPPDSDANAQDATESRPHTAADALDVIAQRIRDGEIDVPGYHEGMSDAALLAALLTAMLGRGR